MAKSKTTLSRRTIRERARGRRRRQKMIPALIVAAVGILLIGAAVYLAIDPGSAQANFKYTAEDIAYERPLHAVHEMEPSSLNSIPFLPKDGPQPKIVLSEDFHNFGSVGPEEVVSYDFVIANQGEAPLTIHRAYTTCGCTTADFTGTVIPPGKVAVVTMTYDAGVHDSRGQTVRRGIIIENNDPNKSQVEFWAQASVRSEP